MRIALLAPDVSQRDGQARYAAELALGLGRRGHQVEVHSVGFEGAAGPGVIHRPLRVPLPGAVRLRFFLFQVALRRLPLAGFDLIHSVGAADPRAHVVTLQFCQAAWQEFLAARAPAALREGPMRRLLGRAIAASEGEQVRRAPRVIAVSRRLAGDAARLYRRGGPVEVIPNGVDLERFHPRLRDAAGATRAALGVAGEARLLGFLGEFERKNLATVLRALALLADPGIWLVAAGRSDPRPFAALAGSLGIGDRVRFPGATTEPERLLAACDAFVFPTLYEPFGMAPLEAAACGTPVVLGREAGLAEWLEGGEAGVLLDRPDDPTGLARAISALLAEPAARDRAGRAARRIAEGFSWDQVVEATERVYADLARSSPRSR